MGPMAITWQRKFNIKGRKDINIGPAANFRQNINDDFKILFEQFYTGVDIDDESKKSDSINAHIIEIRDNIDLLDDELKATNNTLGTLWDNFIALKKNILTVENFNTTPTIGEQQYTQGEAINVLYNAGFDKCIATVEVKYNTTVSSPIIVNIPCSIIKYTSGGSNYIQIIGDAIVPNAAAQQATGPLVKCYLNIQAEYGGEISSYTHPMVVEEIQMEAGGDPSRTIYHRTNSINSETAKITTLTGQLPSFLKL